MHERIRQMIIVFFALILLAGGGPPAQGYVLPGPHVLELMAQKIEKTHSLQVFQKILIRRPGAPEGRSVELVETLNFRFPDALRSDIRSDDTRRLRVRAGGVVLTVIDGDIVADDANPFDGYAEVLLFASRRSLQARLAGLGLNLDVSSFGRAGDRLAYVLGASYPDESLHQIWIDKETFLPFRWLVPGAQAQDAQDRLEIRYLQWRQIAQTWYPMQIEFYHNDRLVRDIRVERVARKSSFPEKLFDIQQLRSAYPAPERGVLQELQEVHETIENFKKIYE